MMHMQQYIIEYARATRGSRGRAHGACVAPHACMRPCVRESPRSPAVWSRAEPQLEAERACSCSRHGAGARACLQVQQAQRKQVKPAQCLTNI